MTKAAIYAGSFDPWTQGHSYVLHCAANIFDEIHIVIGANLAKKNLLSSQIRKQVIYETLVPKEFEMFKNMVRKADFKSAQELGETQLSKHGTVFKLTESTGLIVDYANQHGIQCLVRGHRNATDYEAESQLARCNFALNSTIYILGIFCPQHLIHLSSSFARQVLGSGYQTGTSYLSQSHMLNQSPAAALSEGAVLQSNRLFLGHLFDFLWHELQKDTASENVTKKGDEVQRIFNKVTNCNWIDVRLSVLQFLDATYPKWGQPSQCQPKILVGLLEYLDNELHAATRRS